MLLTKSKFLIGLECPRCFWKAMHENNENKLSNQENQSIDQGKQVGELAKGLFNNYMDLSKKDFKSNLEATRDCLYLNYLIFEAGFKVDNLYARVDILVPNSDESYDIIEVKSNTNVKDKHIYDVAFQKYVCEIAGVDIRHCFVLHLNNSYTKEGEISLMELFVKENVTDRVEDFYPYIPNLIQKLTDIYNMPEAPIVNADSYLFKEYPCSFNSECWSFLPKNNLSKLYGINKNKIAKMFRSNIFEIINMPDDKLNDKQLIQKKSIINNKPYIDKQGIKDFIEKLEYPIYYFDFETFAEAIPRFDGSKTYSKIPFQYSLHKQYEDGSLEHYEFLHKESTDPRKEILLSMLQVLGNNGSIVVFKQSFEKSILNELSSLYPEYGDDINKILERIVDLWEPFSKFHYYNPSQQGSCSIKEVLPAITGRTYEDMDISNGGDASALYFKATFENKFTKEEREKIYSDLLKYCNLDTEGMVWIVDELKKILCT